MLVILYDIIWHRWNAIREIRRDEQAEARAIEREQALEQRQIRRQRQEVLRKHWQELQSNLISLHRVASHLVQQRRFIEEHKDSQDATTKQVLLVMTNRIPVVLSDFGDFWGRVVAQLNVFPQPRDVLALEVLEVIQELGKSVGDSTIEIRDETLLALAELARRVSDPGELPNLADISLTPISQAPRFPLSEKRVTQPSGSPPRSRYVVSALRSAVEDPGRAAPGAPM